MTWRIVQGDCLAILPTLPPAALVYADPPFLTGKRQVSVSGSYADNGELDAMVTRLLAAWDRLDDRGSMVVHLDWHAAAYARVALDRELGRKHFASEIIWRYRRWPAKTQNFHRVHDTLLRYVKTPGESRWNQLYEPLAESTLKTWGDRKQNRATRITDAPSPGCPMGDVWDMPIVAPVAKERTGYPTQKPEALLTRLVLALTDSGDLVIDPYCGSGSSVAAAVKAGRSAIGIDENPEAIAVATKRMEDIECQRQ